MGPTARRHIDELSHKYNGADYANPIGDQGRVILKIAADKVNHAGADRSLEPPGEPASEALGLDVAAV